MKKIIDVFEVENVHKIIGTNSIAEAAPDPGIYLGAEGDDQVAVIVDSSKFGWRSSDKDVYELFRSAPDYSEERPILPDVSELHDQIERYQNTITERDGRIAELEASLNGAQARIDELAASDTPKLEDLLDEEEPEHVFVIRDQARRLNLYERIIDALLSVRNSF